MVRGDRVQHDQEHVGAPGGGNGRPASRHSLIRSCPQSDAASKGTRPATTGKLSRTSRRKPAARRSSSGTSRVAIPRARRNPAGPKIRGEAAQIGGSRVKVQSNRGASQRPRRPHTTSSDSNTPSGEEDQEIGQRDQPDKMAAHPVEMIQVERSLAQYGDSDLEQARDQPAPGREEQKAPRAQSIRGKILGSRTGWAGLLEDSDPTRHQHQPIER